MAIANFRSVGDPAHNNDMQLGVAPSYTRYPHRGVNLYDGDGRDWHANLTVTLGELIEAHALDDLNTIIGKVFARFSSMPMWKRLLDYYNDTMGDTMTLQEYLDKLGEQVAEEFVDQYYTREINAETVREWLHFFSSNLRRSSAKWLPLLNNLDPYEDGWEDWQQRNIGSQYPASSINGSEDYADNSTDIQHSTEYHRKNLQYWQYLMEMLRQYGDPVQAILDDLGVLFHGLLKVEAVNLLDGKGAAGSGYIW